MPDQPAAASPWPALLALLDDQSPTVRRALLAHFKTIGPAVRPHLEAVARGTDATLSAHATWFLAELKFCDPSGDFRAFIRSLNYELESGSLLLARTYTPTLDTGLCRAQLDEIAARCRELIVEPSTMREKCRVINRVLFHEWGFHGNIEHYTDPRNSFLDQVLSRRTGLPISLSIVYLCVAERLGLPLEPVSLPGHFVVGCFSESLPFFIDPFDRGVLREPGEIFELLAAQQIKPRLSDLAPSPIREVLCRCCRNLVNHCAAEGDPDRSRLFASFAEEFETTHERHASS